MLSDLAITPFQALVFGVLTLPVTLWVVYTDLTEMKIRNVAVLVMLGIFAVAGLMVLPLAEYGWRWTHFAVALVLGYVASAALGLGAGDMKYTAAVAPFIPLADLSQVAFLFIGWSVLLLVGFFAARMSSTMRMVAPGWIWLNAETDGGIRKLKTPFGVALAPTVSTYFLLGALA